jgi:hypothetical protein
MIPTLDAVPLTVLERAETLRRLQHEAANDPSFPRAAAERMRVTIRSVQQELQIATCLAKDVRDALRPSRFSNRKVELLALSRVRPTVQRRVVEQLLSGAAPTVRTALEVAA